MTEPGNGSAPAFEVRTGNEKAPGAPPLHRAATVKTAFDALLNIRTLMNAEAADPLATTAEWERRQPVRAIALCLEAAGIPPSAVDVDGQPVATGYRVDPAEPPAVARIEWLGPPGSGAAHQEQEELRRCGSALRALGWQALEYRGPRRHWYLEVEPLQQ
ncbi:hypothetical protein [Streptomyces sp. NPDC048248]|uniref:hypothetical protein n=1 Tax=Streptomyces sp. NPDC048248 TaxID=3365523 RepID=UPI0037245721